MTDDETDAEAYWSLVLCRYGIEYVEDPTTHRRVPTINRTQFTSIFDDENFRSALGCADASQRAIYEREAHEINDIQRGILEISQNEKHFDVFICYKETDAAGRRTQESVLGNELYHQLTQEGLKVFFSRITLEDKLGAAYEPYIFAALNSARVMVVIGTQPENFGAVWVKNEWSRYLALIRAGAKKTLIPAYRDMDPYDLPEEFSHLQAQDMSKLGFMQDLIRGIQKIASDEPKAAAYNTAAASVSDPVAPLLKRAFLALEDGEWQKADAFCEQVLNTAPENAQAYLGKLMAELRCASRADLGALSESFDANKNYAKIMRFSDDALKREMDEYIAEIEANCQRKKEAKLGKFFEEGKLKIERSIIEARKGIEKAEEAYRQAATKAEQDRIQLPIKIAEQEKRFAQLKDDVDQAAEKHAKAEAELSGLSGIRKLKLGKTMRQEVEAALSEKRRAEFTLSNTQRELERLKKKYTSIDDDMNKSREKAALEKEKWEKKLCDHENSDVIEVAMQLYYDSFIKGKTLKFGRYRRNNGSSQMKDIEWIVFYNVDRTAFLISKYCLETAPYNSYDVGTFWTTSSLRLWLNNEFFSEAFSEAERRAIATVSNSNPNNPQNGTMGGDKTNDRVFLLSIGEANANLSRSTMKAQLLPNTSGSGVYWWLRTPGVDQRHASFVTSDGSIAAGGAIVNNPFGVRPVIAVNVDILLDSCNV